jgi:hypothetical protein
MGTKETSILSILSEERFWEGRFAEQAFEIPSFLADCREAMTGA